MLGINVNQITSMLAKLPDQSLQQYAAMHKDNPYIVSLAVAESNRRKDLRSAGAQQPMQPQPKVADAAIAQMALPEELGIGALPAPNMQGMADGGIAGYADGGEVEGYAGGGSIPRYAGVPEFGSVVRSGVTNPNAAFIEFLKQMGVSTQDFIQFSPQAQTALREKFATGATAAPQAAPAAATTAAQAAPAATAAAQAAPQAAPAAAQAAAPAAKSGLRALAGRFLPAAGRAMGWGSVALHSPELNQDENAWLTKRKLMDSVFPPKEGQPERLVRAAIDPNITPSMFKKVLAQYQAESASGESTKADAAAKADTGEKAGAGEKGGAKDAKKAAGSASGASADAGMFSLANLKKQQEEAMGPLNYELGALRNQAAGLGAELERGASERLSKRKEEIEKEGDIYAGRAKRIEAREAALGKEKDTVAGLALLEAGLTIMGTSGNLGQAVSAGGKAGLRSYGAGLEKLRAAQEKLEEAKDRTEELRLNRSDMNKREIRELERDRDNAILKGKELMYGVAKDIYGYNRQDANALINRAFEGQKTVYEQGQTTERTRMTVAPQLERNALLRGGQAEQNKVRAEYGKLQKNVMDSLAKDVNYQLAKPAEKMTMENDALRRALMNNPFLSSYAAGIGFSSTPTGPVYDLTEAE